jgi:hypothetical protein
MGVVEAAVASPDRQLAGDPKPKGDVVYEPCPSGRIREANARMNSDTTSFAGIRRRRPRLPFLLRYRHQLYDLWRDAQARRGDRWPCLHAPPSSTTAGTRNRHVVAFPTQAPGFLDAREAYRRISVARHAAVRRGLAPASCSFSVPCI